MFFKKLLKPQTPNVGFEVFFLLRNLRNKPRIPSLIVICEIRQFHRHFSLVFFSFAHWRFVFSKRYGVWDVFRVLFGRTFVFGSSYKNTFKTLKSPFKTF